ncbi:XTP/dITP diphosphatase [Sporosarcina sp. P21c]|uniref:XTP/dITP diphosphatase n=1 Tax=Sporosarcina TaxID=1569 RepID=UPI000A153012|nr:MULTISPECIES: XTP/dITP diphosphatase [Sporosarcina]ARJ37924.1 non-canonical purine NTP pyrophosphatase [Sporosarcina ureae]PIC67762.1 XTP/dITP diphosphatase [Sporosarcina sp. P16a]PIC83755.1 XTP/dITP diphosphatase [Sporosarcina sp. P1]PIC90621.1 XTP/dITP diphosphatase [Sporosarcina sp. P21c]PIC93387.1 XTP/dITP diphosphatase [Sporosarcina sp. P25]
MKEVLIATNNTGKAKDFEVLFRPLGITVLTLQDIEESIDVEETGTTFVENAILKAETVANLLGKVVIADDSGLEVDALNGEPGVYSARYAGEPSNDEANIDKLLANLVEVPETARQARFRCVLAIAGPTIETTTYSGSCEGFITDHRQGTNGFGYDPIFYVPSKEKTMAQLSAEEKSAISHRGAALAQLKERLPEFIAKFGEMK